MTNVMKLVEKAWDRDLRKGDRVRLLRGGPEGREGTIIRIMPGRPNDLAVTVRLDTPLCQSDNPDWVMRRTECERVT